MKKIKLFLVASIVINLILGYFLFYNWQAKNLLYMDGYYRLSNSSSMLTHALNAYVENGSEVDFRLAIVRCQSASIGSRIFNSYFQGHIGYRLSNELHKFYNNILVSLSEKDIEELKKSAKHLEELNGVLKLEGIDESRWRFRSGWHYSKFPSHPIGHKQAERLLNIVKEINEELEK